MPGMEIRNLRTLVAIADHGGFAAAGAAIGLTQSAVSVQVKQLESELGATLFDRSHRPPRLNARGRKLVDDARELLALHRRMIHGGEREAGAGRLRLGAVPTVSSGVLPAALAELARRLPALEVDLASDLSDALTSATARGELDAALVTQPDNLAPGLTWKPCQHEDLVLITPRRIKGGDYREILARHPLIRFRRLAWAGRLIDDLLRAEGIGHVSRMELDSLEAIAGLVAHGLGVAVVPRRNIPRPFPPGIRVHRFGRRLVRRTIGIVEPADNPRGRFVDELRDILSKPHDANRRSETS